MEEFIDMEYNAHVQEPSRESYGLTGGSSSTSVLSEPSSLTRVCVEVATEEILVCAPDRFDSVYEPTSLVSSGGETVECRTGGGIIECYAGGEITECHAGGEIIECHAGGEIIECSADGESNTNDVTDGVPITAELKEPEDHLELSPPPRGGQSGVELLEGEKIPVVVDDERFVSEIGPSEHDNILLGEREVAPSHEARPFAEIEADSETLPMVTLFKPKSQSARDLHNVTGRGVATPPGFSLSSIVKDHIRLGEHSEMVEELIYWRQPRRSAVVFLSVMAVLMCMQFCSLISVLAYVSLVGLMVGLAGRAYSSTQGAEHPVLVVSSAFKEENVRKMADVMAFYVNDTILQVRRLFLAEDVGDSLKFGLVLWYLTYVGSWFNGMTIVTVSFVTIFTLPSVYEFNKKVIDNKMAVCWDKWIALADSARAISQMSFDRVPSVKTLQNKNV